MEIGIIREDGGGGRMGAGVAEEFAVLAIDAREVSDDFGEADNGKAGSVDDRLDPLCLEFGADATEEFGVWEGITQRSHETSGVHVTGGFAGRNEEGGGGRFHFSYTNAGGKAKRRRFFRSGI